MGTLGVTEARLVIIVGRPPAKVNETTARLSSSLICGVSRNQEDGRDHLDHIPDTIAYSMGTQVASPKE